MDSRRLQMDQGLLAKLSLSKKKDLRQSSMQLWSDFAQIGCEFACDSPKSRPLALIS